MVHLRATKKVLDRIGVEPMEGPESQNALGDWYVNRFVWGRQPILVLMSSTSRLTTFIPARNVRQLPERLTDLVRYRLLHLGIPSARVDREIDEMGDVLVARTKDRSTLSAMSRLIEDACAILDRSSWEGEALLPALEDHMADHLIGMRGKGYVHPGDETYRLLL